MTINTVKRAYKYRFYPTDEQAQLLARTFGCARLVYNKALDIRSKAWTNEQKNVSSNDVSKLLPEWKKTEELAFLNEVSSVALQQSLNHLQTAFTNFFGKRAKYPTFKKRANRQSASFTVAAFSWDESKREIKLAKTKEPLDIVWSRNIPIGARISSLTVSRDPAMRWYVSMLAEVDIPTLSKNDKSVGIDLGVLRLATLSDGTEFVNPRSANHLRTKLVKAQRAHARKAKGSKNREKSRIRVARIHAAIADRRHDNLHKVTTQIVRENQTIILEDLNVRGMTSNGGSYKRGLNRAISDASFAEFRTMLEYKAKWYGREVVVIDRFYPSSQLCSSCGNRKKLMLSQRQYECDSCGLKLDRDLNAAKNIVAVGLTVLAYGDGMKPSRAKRDNVSVVEVGNPVEQFAGIPRL